MRRNEHGGIFFRLLFLLFFLGFLVGLYAARHSLMRLGVERDRIDAFMDYHY